jgi:glucose/mannose-6-phosphate isomerase
VTIEVDLARFDQNKLYNIYSDWPKYFEDSLKFSCVPRRPKDDYKALLLCGMGGSATSNDILYELMNIFGDIPTFVLKGQMMPQFVDERSVVIVNSVSGNTAETLMMMREAIKRNAEVICISSGGMLEEEAYGSRCKHIKIPNLSIPRASLPYLLIPGLTIISPFLRISLEDELQCLPENISSIFKDIMIDIPEEHNIAKRIANFLLGGFPFCYASPVLLPAATRLKNSINENAKMHCLRESILEASHNDIVPFTFTNTPVVPKILHLRWKYDNSAANERFDKVRSLFEKVVHSVMDIPLLDKSLLNALVSAIYILDVSTIYMAIAKNTDPSPTPAIQILKDLKL